MMGQFDEFSNADLVKAFLNTRDNVVAAREEQLKLELEPHRKLMAAIEAEMLARSIKEKTNSFATDSGTCYKSSIKKASVKNPAEFLPWLYAQGVEAMQAMLTAAVSKDAVYQYVDTHSIERGVDEHGQPKMVPHIPPGIELGGVTKMNFKAK